jgi:hypothetical protein
MLAGFTSLQKKKSGKKRKYWIHNMFRAREGEGEFYALFGRLKDAGKNFSNILE